MTFSKTQVTKLIVPLAGLGTRFLPLSNSMPKEMFLLVNKPVLQYTINEAHQSGIKEIIFILNPRKNIIADYFSPAYHQSVLRKTKANTASAKEDFEELNKLFKGIKFHQIKKTATLGDGHSILLAKNMIGAKEPFAVTMGDLLSPPGKQPFIKQLIGAYSSKNSAVVAVEKVPLSETTKFGVIATKRSSGKYHLVGGIIEKPGPERAPSNMILTGKYILKPDIFPYLDSLVKAHKGGEVRLADALKIYSGEHDLYAYECDGKIQDTGNKLDLLKTTVNFGIHHPGYGNELRKFIKTLKI